MKRLTLFALFFFIISSYTAYAADAFWTGSVFNDSLGIKVPNVQNFDWASSGSGNAQGVGPIGTPLAVGTTFNFRYQSFLFALNAPNGQPITFPGLNSTFEYTVVAMFPEVVSSFSSIGGISTAVFTTLPGGQFFIYHDAPANANVAAGTGFDDGTLVASGTIDAGQTSVFTASSTTAGIGSALIYGKVTSANPAYLDPASLIVNFRFEGTLNYPPFDSTTAGFFDGNAFPRYVVGPNDLTLKVDGSNKFTVGPAIKVTKTCTDAAGAGQPITFSATVTNTGGETLTGITCVDNPVTPLTGVPSTLVPGASATVTGSYIPSTSPSTDTLTCSGTGAISGTTVSNSGSATCKIITRGPGCTFTIGYWKTHAGFGPQADVVTPLLPIWLGTPGGAKSIDVTTAQIAVDILSQNVYGTPSNGITKLYAQLLGAKLNIANGADGSAVASTIAAADAFLATHNFNDWSSLSQAEKNIVLGWQGILDNFNEGIIGPGECD